MNAAPKTDPLVEYVQRSLELDDPDEIDRRAGELSVMGYDRTASHLRRHATGLRAGHAKRPRMVFRSPIPEASDEQWARFVGVMETGDVSAVTSTGQLGVFQTRLKRLEDLGLAHDVRRVQGDPASRHAICGSGRAR